MAQHVDIVFDGPPGPESGRLIEVEDVSGRSIRFGHWIERQSASAEKVRVTVVSRRK